MGADFGDAPGPLTIDRSSCSGGNCSLRMVEGDDGRCFLDRIGVTNDVFRDNAHYGPFHDNVPLERKCGNTLTDTTPWMPQVDRCDRSPAAGPPAPAAGPPAPRCRWADRC
jgi:hypothetical protein